MMGCMYSGHEHSSILIRLYFILLKKSSQA